MPKHIPALATRAAVVATTTAAAALVAVLPATTVAAAPATPAPAVSTATSAALSVAPVALATPAPAAVALPAAPAVSAMSNALGKIGAPYRWGAAGPTAFDCSGLVSWAFKNAGIPLPRSSRAMSKVGTPVARADLRPGDLVFFYRPVSHVGIYIGDGKIVHASSRKSPVKVSDMNRMPFNSARRI